MNTVHFATGVDLDNSALTGDIVWGVMSELEGTNITAEATAPNTEAPHLVETPTNLTESQDTTPKASVPKPEPK